ncbi:MAG TPA: BrnA antitoxin family protein [Duganella sp.]
MPRLKQGTVLPTKDEDAAITSAAMQDPDAKPYTDEEWEGARPTRGRGRPAGSGTKVAMNIRLDRDLVEAFKGTGEGWQTRLNDALRDWAKNNELLTVK